MAIKELRILVAGYGLPAEFGLVTLLGMGIPLSSVALLTHAEDERNMGLRSIAKLRGIAICDAPARSREALQWVSAFAPDGILSLHYRNLIPNEMIAMCCHGGINLHPSLLPKYRGTNSVAWAIINGEQTTGFSFHLLSDSFDTGDLIFQESISIDAFDTAFSLFHKQISRAMSVLEDVLSTWLSGNCGWKQVGDGTYYPRKLPFDGIIDRTWELEYIERFIRAMYFPPFPPAMYSSRGQMVPIPDMATFLRIREMG